MLPVVDQDNYYSYLYLSLDCTLLSTITIRKEKDAQNLEQIDYFSACIICIQQLESNQQDEKFIKEIENSQEKVSGLLFTNGDYVSSRHDNSKVLARSAVMWTCVLPYLNNQAILKRFCQNSFSGLKGLNQFLQVSINKDLKWACNCQISYYLFDISVSKDVIKSMSMLKDNESFNDVSIQNMTALHFLNSSQTSFKENSNKNNINALTLFLHKNEIDTDLANCMIKSMNKSKNVLKENQVYNTFVGFLSIKFCARSNLNVIKRSIESQYYEKLIQKFETTNFDEHYAAQIAYLLDEWIVYDKTLAQKICYAKSHKLQLH